MATGMFDFGPSATSGGSGVGAGINFNPSASPGSSGGVMPIRNYDPLGGLGFDTYGNQTGGNAPAQGGGYSPINNPSSSSNPYASVFGSTNGTLPFYGSAPGQVPGNLSQAFGPLGPFLLAGIETGGYNPAVFQALVNQLGPQIAEGEATIGANTGASGTRFGSGYDLALGDFLSQVNLNEQGLAANLYQNSVQNSFGLLGQALNPLSQFASNQGGFSTALLTSLIGSLGPGLIKNLPGLSGGSSSPFPTSGGIPPIFNYSSYNVPGGTGTPNASDPFGNSIPS